MNYYFLFNALVVQQQNYTSERIVQNSPRHGHAVPDAADVSVPCDGIEWVCELGLEYVREGIREDFVYRDFTTWYIKILTSTDF